MSLLTKLLPLKFCPSRFTLRNRCGFRLAPAYSIPAQELLPHTHLGQGQAVRPFLITTLLQSLQINLTLQLRKGYLLWTSFSHNIYISVTSGNFSACP